MTEPSSCELAIFGCAPTFPEPLHVGRPNLGDRSAFLARMEAVLDRRWLTNNGPMVAEFEQRLAGWLGVRHCIAMCNATVALEIAARALGLRGEVIVPSFTFIATAHALQRQEITPVFCDIDPATHNIDPRRVEQLITPRTTGILGVHLWGRPCATEELEEIARRRGLRLLFDAAHALGASHGGRMIGGFGNAEVFSFHATKFVNSFEGGAVTTDDDELAGRIRLMKNFGFAGYDHVVYPGTNGKMSEVSAAMGLTSLDSMPDFVARNRENYARYCQGVAGLGGVKMVEYDALELSNYQYVVLEVDEEEAGLSRDDLLEVLWAENVFARRYFYPGCHRMEPYRSLYPDVRVPETEKLASRVLLLPTGTAVSQSEIDLTCTVVRRAVTSATAVRARIMDPEYRRRYGHGG
jgi:dTDP-4-amino-4,6-dideoxygalactose transaminase